MLWSLQRNKTAQTVTWTETNKKQQKTNRILRCNAWSKHTETTLHTSKIHRTTQTKSMQLSHNNWQTCPCFGNTNSIKTNHHIMWPPIANFHRWWCLSGLRPKKERLNNRMTMSYRLFDNSQFHQHNHQLAFLPITLTRCHLLQPHPKIVTCVADVSAAVANWTPEKLKQSPLQHHSWNSPRTNDCPSTCSFMWPCMVVPSQNNHNIFSFVLHACEGSPGSTSTPKNIHTKCQSDCTWLNNCKCPTACVLHRNGCILHFTTSFLARFSTIAPTHLLNFQNVCRTEPNLNLAMRCDWSICLETACTPPNKWNL